MLKLGIKDIIFDYENNDITKIIYKLEASNYFSKKIYFYNAQSINPIQKYIIYINRCKITMHIGGDDQSPPLRT